MSVTELLIEDLQVGNGAEATAGKCKSYAGSLVRLADAKKIISTTIFDLIKKNPKADIAGRLAAADKEYNAGN